jgi:hypothetical protein
VRWAAVRLLPSVAVGEDRRIGGRAGGCRTIRMGFNFTVAAYQAVGDGSLKAAQAELLETAWKVRGLLAHSAIGGQDPIEAAGPLVREVERVHNDLMGRVPTVRGFVRDVTTATPAAPRALHPAQPLPRALVGHPCRHGRARDPKAAGGQLLPGLAARAGLCGGVCRPDGSITPPARWAPLSALRGRSSGAFVRPVARAR